MPENPLTGLLDRSLVGPLILAHVAAFAFLVDERMRPTLNWLEPVWIVALLLAFPLGAALAVEGRHVGGRVIGGLFGAGALVMPVGRWLISSPREVFIDHPAWLIAPTAACVAVLAVTAAIDLDLDRFGLGKGDVRWWAPRTALLLAACVPFVLIAASLFPSLLEYYPSKIARGGNDVFVQAMLGRGLYFVAWEWFFRGFLVFGLAPAIGTRGALLAQAYPFLLLHRTKPVAEMSTSFTGAIALGAFCLRARSMWPAFLLHYFLNVLVEVAGLMWHINP